MRNQLIIICMLFSLGLLAQEKICIGEKYNIYSQQLDEEQQYWIYLPPNYNNEQFGKASYPVIYLLDGDKNFLSTVAIQQTFTKGMYNNMPECIIVGILNTDRTRDLTPSKSYLLHKGKKMFENSGGSDTFLKFLTQELRNKVESDYRTNGYNILIGHSFGGLFAMNTLIHHTDTFNAYIIIDPSLWWDNNKMYNDAKKMWCTTDFRGKSLYMAIAKDEDDNASDNSNHTASIKTFCNDILKLNSENLNVKWKFYKNEDHGTIVTPGVFDGLREVFRGITLPVKEVPYNPELIIEHYKKLSDKLTFNFIPDEILVDNIGKYALSVENIDGAIKIFEYNLINYPTSKNAKESLDNAFKIKNKK